MKPTQEMRKAAQQRRQAAQAERRRTEFLAAARKFFLTPKDYGFLQLMKTILR